MISTTNKTGIEPSVEKLNLDRIAWKVTHDQFKPEMSEDEVSRAIHQYRRFLSLKIRYPGVNLVPTDDIDLIWHAHILDTGNYASDCQRLFGSFLHHEPYFGELGEETKDDMEEMFTVTSHLWKNEFGEPLEEPALFRCAGKACHAPTSCRCR